MNAHHPVLVRIVSALFVSVLANGFQLKTTAAEMRPQQTSSADEAQRHYRTALAALKSDDPETAYRELKLASQMDPTNDEIRRALDVVATAVQSLHQSVDVGAAISGILKDAYIGFEETCDKDRKRDGYVQYETRYRLQGVSGTVVRISEDSSTSNVGDVTLSSHSDTEIQMNLADFGADSLHVDKQSLCPNHTIAVFTLTAPTGSDTIEKASTSQVMSTVIDSHSRVYQARTPMMTGHNVVQTIEIRTQDNSAEEVLELELLDAIALAQPSPARRRQVEQRAASRRTDFAEREARNWAESGDQGADSAIGLFGEARRWAGNTITNEESLRRMENARKQFCRGAKGAWQAALLLSHDPQLVAKMRSRLQVGGTLTCRRGNCENGSGSMNSSDHAGTIDAVSPFDCSGVEIRSPEDIVGETRWKAFLPR